MTTYLSIFRTHVWDGYIAQIAEAARSCCASAAFIVAVDESRGPISVEPFFKLPHTSDFHSQGMPNLPEGRVLWWNADYPLYMIREQYPGFDYYVMIEYDALLNCDFDKIIANCVAEKLDLIIHKRKRINANIHWSFESISEMDAEHWQALIPVVVLSAQLVDKLLEVRKSMAAAYLEGSIKMWPYCEAFIPTVALKYGMKVEGFSRFIDATLLRFRPFLSLRDEKTKRPEGVAHPVMGGQRFIKAFMSTEPRGSHILTDGCLREELEHEDPADIRAVFGKEFPCFDPQAHQVPPPHLQDVAKGKPATQSSRSQWSFAPTIWEDAGRANWANVDPVRGDFAFHTNTEEDPWWAVDLLEECTVEQVEVVNRAAYPHRFRHFRIETSLDQDAWSTFFRKTDGALVSANPLRPALFRSAEPVRARYLRIVLEGTNCMHLRRVRVLGTVAD